MKRFLFLLTIIPFIDSVSGWSQSYSMSDNINISDVIESSPMKMPSVWTFRDCVDWAIANNNDVRRTMLSILKAEENIGMAKDAYLPNVGFSTNQSFTNYPAPQTGQNNNSYNSSYNVNASWTIWEGNIRKYRLESAKVLKQQQLLSGDDIIKNLELGILQAYMNILYSAEAIQIARQSLEVSTAQAERSKRLMETGKLSKVDYMQIESQKAQDQYNLVQAQTSYASSKVTLKNILNLSLDYDLQIAEMNFEDAQINSPLPTKTEVFDLAAAWLPQFKSNELNKTIYDYDLKIAKASYYPTISLSGGIGTGYNSGGTSGWGTQMKNFFNENVGVNLSVPIYDGNATKRAVAIAKLNALEYDLNKTALYNELSQTLENLFIESENARAKYIAGLTQLESTELTAQLVDRQFELGLVNPLDLLTAHNNLLNSRLELLQSKYMAILANKTIEYYSTQQVSLP
ncbi:MAG: TolC family protein [Muribaculaceae bacterium]|nr:TolC family protein [Muribaculaceae bacterium]